MTRRVRGSASVLVLAGLVLGGNAVAAADEPCPLLDPICVVDDTIDEVEETVDEVTDTVDEVTDPIDPGDPGDPDDPDDGPGASDDPDGHAGGGEDGRGDGGHERPGGGTEPAMFTSTSTSPSRVTSREATADDVPPVLLGPRGRAGATAVSGPTPLLVRTAAGLGVMAVLLGLAVAFVAFQHALDRRDPKLAPDALGSDRVPFA